MKPFLLILFSFWLCSVSNAQEISSDTLLAREYLGKAKSLIYFRQFSKLDSVLILGKQAEILFGKHNDIKGTLESKCIELQAFARKKDEQRTFSLYDSISNLSMNHFGEKNLYLSNALYSLGIIHNSTSKVDLAIDDFRRSVEMRNELSGEKNLDNAQTFMNIGLAYESKRDYDKALEYFNKSLEIRKAILGEKDFNVAQCYFNIAIEYRLKSMWDKVAEYFLKSLEIRREVYGEKHEDVGLSYINLGVAYENLKDYQKALDSYFKSVECFIEVFGENHSYVATGLNNIGIAYNKLREYDNALEYYLKGLNVRLKVYGENNIDVSDSYNNAALIYGMKGEYEKALDFQTHSMEIRKVLLGPRNIRVAENFLSIGNLYRNLSDYDTSLDYYLKCLEIRLEVLGPKHIEVAKCYNNIGLVYVDLSEYDKALEYDFKSLELFRELLGDKHINLSTTYNNIGIVYMAKSEFNKALEYYTKALELRKSVLGDNNLDVAASYINLATYYLNQSDFPKVLEYNFLALDIRKRLLGENSLDVAASYNNIAMMYTDMSEYDKALEYYQMSLKIRLSRLEEMHTDVASSYNNIAGLYDTKSEYDKALMYYKKSLDIRVALLGENSIDVAQSYHNMGRIYNDLSEDNLSLEYYLKALNIRLKLLGENHISVANTYSSIGDCYMSKAENEKALEYNLKALEIRKNLYGEKNTSVADSYSNLGAIYDGKGEYEKSLSYQIKSLDINIELLGEKSRSVARNYGNIGSVYFSLGNIEKSLEYLTKSYSIDMDILGNRSIEVSNDLINIGKIHSEKSDFDTASEYYKRSLAIRRELLDKKHYYLTENYNLLGYIGEENGDYESALDYYQKSICANLRDFNDTLGFAVIPRITDYIDYFQLLQAFFQKAQIFELMADSSIRVDKRGIKKLKIADLYKLSIQNYILCDQIIEQTRKKISLLADKMLIGSMANQMYECAIGVSLKLNELGIKNGSASYLDLAFYFSEQNKSMVLLEAMAGQEGLKFAGIPDSILEREHFLKVDIAFLEKQLARSSDKKDEANFRNLLFAANREYENLTQMIEKEFPNYYNLKYSAKLPSVREIQGLLDDKTAIRSYFAGDSTTYIFTLSRSNIGVKKTTLPVTLTDSIIWYRYGLTNTAPRMQNAYKRLGYLLYQYLFPDSSSIPKNITNLIIIPDGPMATIPFESLLTYSYSGPTDNYREYPYLINKYDISYSYSANLLYKTFPKTASQTVEFTEMDDWLAFAPVFDDKDLRGDIITTRVLQGELKKFKTDTIMVSRGMFHGGYITPLPATETEAEEILKLFDSKNLKGSILLHNSANEEFVKSGRLGKSRVLHFATHGFVNSERPELSGLLLAPDTTGGQDGVLYSGEIYNLKLNADLVLLSACETGLGKIQKGEGIIGLTRALLYAGAKNIIVSLWQVSDRSTSELMVDFYRNSLNSEKQNLSYSESLRKAKMLMIQQGKYSHPLYWSPFILIGK